MSTDQDQGWVSLCSLSSLTPGELRPAEIHGIPVLVLAGSTRHLVVPRSCPHMSNSLEDGVFDGHVLTCTKHLWQWSIDEGGAPIGEAEAPLLCYETRESGDDLLCRATEELRYEHEDEDY